MTLPTNGPYAQLMGSFFGFLSTEQQQGLWSTFLNGQHLSTNPSDTDTVAQAQFMSYIQSSYDKMQELELSPIEIQRRHLVFTVFDIILLMMQNIQDTVGVQQGLLVSLGKMQEQYTDMISRVPIYVGGASNNAVYNDELDKFTLGYNNISVKELLEYALETGNTSNINSYDIWLPDANNAAPRFNYGIPVSGTGLAGPFFFKNADGINDAPGARMVITPDLGSGTITVTVYQMKIQPPPSTWTPQQVNRIALYQEQQVFQQVIPITSSTFSEQLTEAMTGFQTNVNPFFSGFASKDIPRVPYAQDVTDDHVPITTVHVAGESDDEAVTATAIANLRAQKNSVMQQYIDAARSRRETLQNQSDAVSTNMDTSRQAIKGQSGIMLSIIQQARNILDSIFKS